MNKLLPFGSKTSLLTSGLAGKQALCQGTRTSGPHTVLSSPSPALSQKWAVIHQSTNTAHLPISGVEITRGSICPDHGRSLKLQSAPSFLPTSQSGGRRDVHLQQIAGRESPAGALQNLRLLQAWACEVRFGEGNPSDSSFENSC